MTIACGRVRKHLGAFVDGELGGAERLRVAHHLAACASCADEHQSIRDVGEMLRATAPSAPAWVDLTGLASGVITRMGAEDAQSWRAMFGRAIEDWHWTLVGAGSITAAFASILFVSVVCWFSPAASRDDSLAALLNNLGTPAGTLVMMATPVGRDQVPRLMQFDNGAEGPDTGARATLPAGFSGPSESDLVLALSQAVVSPDGRMSDLRSMSQGRAEFTMQFERYEEVPQSILAELVTSDA